MSEESIIVRGGNPLLGTVRIAGAKNSVLKLMAASLLAEGVTTIENAPLISDVALMGDVLRKLGATVAFDGHRVTIDTSKADSIEAPYEFMGRIRASIVVLGPLLGRFNRARVAMPGGDQIGERKLDMHIQGLEALGVKFAVDHGYINASAPQGLKGASVSLGFPSVGATENLMLAAVKACGTTTIDNAAREPEIVDLANCLVCMGAHIEGAGTSVIEIEGVTALGPAQGYHTVGDRIEAGTFLVAGALCGGPLTLQGINPCHLDLPVAKLRSMGCTLETGDNSITISHTGPFQPVDIQTLPYPGFPTDLQAQFMVLDAIAQGSSIITENVFEKRFVFTGELARMGADIRIEGHRALINGVRKLSGAPVASPDLRAGAALVLAGLVADDKTVVSGVEHIDRGYEGFVDKLRSLGANITREA
ncbi:MAG: UDP-N-acetylglucosamine 1-carboxyvinyltransferase [Coriobacteriales bacterium]|nr:UDP-N-acetylglucosamine 1-carboxyvinyltransferase [Coriobacteriales bacterium]